MDVLNVLLVFSKKFVDMFKQYYPSNLLVDVDNGEFNTNFHPSKDISLGLEVLFG